LKPNSSVVSFWCGGVYPSHDINGDKHLTEIKLFIDAGQDSSAKMIGKHRACAYFVLRVDENGGRRGYWGIGNFKDTQAAFAEGILAASGVQDPDDFPIFAIVAESPGFWQRVAQTLEKEINEPRKAEKADQRETWKKLTGGAALLNLSDPRKPISPSEERELKAAKELRLFYAKKAVTEVPTDHSGLFSQGELELDVVS
jgi:hypothetical protein